jgi:glycosyltransferase involved in cell wall biosynthesis
MPESLVSVCIASFNQEEFISDCLTSVLTQKTNFEFEIIIGDDASTDNTQHIIRITCKNKKNCKIVLREKNLGCPFNGLDIWAKANSKYIAIVDGDDYWTDPYKLQKQVDYLEANPHVSCCATRFDAIDNNTVKKTLFPNHKKIIKHDLESVLNSNWSPIQTLTMVFRSELLKPKLHLLANNRIYAGDYAMTVLLAIRGEIHVLPDNTGNKRVDSGGVWESLHDSLKCRKLIETMDETSKFIPHKYKKLVAARVTHHADYLLQNVSTNGRDLFKTSMFLLKLHLRNRNLTILCLKYILNFIRVKLGSLKPQF